VCSSDLTHTYIHSQALTHKRGGDSGEERKRKMERERRTQESKPKKKFMLGFVVGFAVVSPVPSTVVFTVASAVGARLRLFGSKIGKKKKKQIKIE
jgi:hypothetical protein